MQAYEVSAYNTARESENRIHDDAVAQRFGFTGGLVPGVDVYGYMAHLPVQRWGRAWLERGTASCRFAKPVYDGRIAVVTARDAGGHLDIAVHSEGTLCATGHAALPDPAPPPRLDDFVEAVPPHSRPAADEASLAEGTWLGTRPVPLTAAFAAQYRRDLRETERLYGRARLAHPGFILRLCNWALTHNVVLGPWIHVGSAVVHHGVARVGDTLSVRARVAANYAHKGHRFVELDALVLANGRMPVARVAHTAIYRPRQAA